MPYRIFVPPPARQRPAPERSSVRDKLRRTDRRTRRLAAGRSVQNSQSGFSSKKVRISSNKHHHIELVASLGASPLASAGSFASRAKGFLKSISSRSAARRRFTNEIRIAQRAMSRFFSFAFGERQSENLLNCRCRRFPFSITIKQTNL